MLSRLDAAFIKFCCIGAAGHAVRAGQDGQAGHAVRAGQAGGLGKSAGRNATVVISYQRNDDGNVDGNGPLCDDDGNGEW